MLDVESRNGYGMPHRDIREVHVLKLLSMARGCNGPGGIIGILVIQLRAYWAIRYFKYLL